MYTRIYIYILTYMKIDIVDVNTTIRIVFCLPQRDPKRPVGFKNKRNTN